MSATKQKKRGIQFCDPYVWENPTYLFSFGKDAGCVSEYTNFIILVYIVSILFGLIATHITHVTNLVFFAIAAATFSLVPTFKKLHEVESFRMQFVGSENVHEDSEDPDKLLQQALVQPPTSIMQEGFVTMQPKNGFNQTGVPGNPPNPFNNILINEYEYTPTRPAAPDINTAEAKIALDDFFRVQFYSDPTDVFGKSQSQRQFITQPSTTIPNDQGSYQNWLYMIPGKTCKEGNPEACYGGTNGSPLPSLNN